MSSVASARYCSRLPTSEPSACSHSPLPAVCRRAIHDVVASVRTCLSEDMVAELTKCIRTNLDCADICTTTGAVLPGTPAMRPTSPVPSWRSAVSPVQAAGTECEAHADMHEHCRICAEACRRCEAACVDLLGSLG